MSFSLNQLQDGMRRAEAMQNHFFWFKVYPLTKLKLLTVELRLSCEELVLTLR